MGQKPLNSAASQRKSIARRKSQRTRKVTKDNHLDPYFTSDSLANSLVSALNKRLDLTRHFDAFIEPSAGQGAFVKAIKGAVKSPIVFAYDIQPKAPGIKRANFLTLRNPAPGFSNAHRNRIMCIGNPPFGCHGSVAGEFIQQCSRVSDHIAFILPIAFSLDDKYLNRHAPVNYHIAWSKELRNTEFKTNGNQSKFLNVAFVYLKNLGYPRTMKAIPKSNISTHKHFEILVAPSMAERKRANLRIRGTGFNAGECFLNGNSSFFINKQRTDDWFVILRTLAAKRLQKSICRQLNETKWKFQNLVPNVKYLKRKQLEVELEKMIH